MMVGMKIVHCIVNDYVGTFDMDEDNSLFVLTIIRNVQSNGDKNTVCINQTTRISDNQLMVLHNKEPLYISNLYRGMGCKEYTQSRSAGHQWKHATNILC